MGKLLKGMLSVVRFARSRTSQNSILGVGSIVAVIQFLRTRYPEYVLWNSEADALIEGALIAVVGPYLGRAIAFLRAHFSDDIPKLRKAGLLALLMTVGLSIGVVGCTTTSTLPDGTIIVKTTDWQAIFDGVDAALERYERIEARRDAAEAAGEAEKAARLDAILVAITKAVEENKEGGE